MAAKKEPGRFTIKFNEKDHGHRVVIRLLEEQGPHSKAQFIANAILHYIHCTETPDISFGQPIDKESIREVVLEILQQREMGQTQESMQQDTHEMPPCRPVGKSESMPQKNNEIEEKLVDDTARNLIAEALSSFRNI